MSLKYKMLLEKLEKANQLHLLRFYNEFNDDKKNEFIEHLSTLDYEKVGKMYITALNSPSKEKSVLDNKMSPIPSEMYESEGTTNQPQIESYRSLGFQQISQGHVGVILLAGGQSTRLGASCPKGMYPLGLLSNKTLLQIQAERISKLQDLAKHHHGEESIITWYIMTSFHTHRAIKDFLDKHTYFGLNAKNVVLFQQENLPCFDCTGKIILQEKDRVALAPDGNGGLFSALKNNKILDDMKNRGILYVQVHSVDNILVKVADPLFVGYCVSRKADCGNKVVWKTDPHESIGVVCLVDGRVEVVEYSEISEEVASLRNNEGELVYRAGNICNHFFSIAFLKIVVEEHINKIKLHTAMKKVPYINDAGRHIVPLDKNAIKIEKFVFDVFKFSTNFVVWEVPRYSDFSALKNADDVGKDCPATVRKDLYNLHKKYVERSGGVVIGDEIEISPLLSYAGENLHGKVSGKKLKTPVLLLE